MGSKVGASRGRAVRNRWKTVLRLAVLVSTVGWSLGCMLAGLSGAQDRASESSTAFLDGTMDSGLAAPPDGTTLWGSWGGEVTCPSTAATIDLELVHQGPGYFAGPAAIDLDDPLLEFDVDVVYEGEELVRDLAMQASDCDECPRFEAVVWDMTTLPAVITGEIEGLVADEVCTFDLRATHDR